MSMLALAIALFLAQTAQPTGKIVFFREPHAMTGDFKPLVFCDGEEIARIENGTYFEIDAPPGLHKCSAESLQRGTIEVNVVAGKSAYVHVNLLKGWTNHAALANTTADEFEKQKARLKPVKEWSRTALSAADGKIYSDQNPPPPATKHAKDKHSGKFGDLAVSVTHLAVTPASNPQSRDMVAVFVSTQNTGKGVLCAELGATLNTSFGLQYRGFTGLSSGFPPAPRIKEMLPGETVEGSYKFDIKHGVQPLEIVIRLQSARYDGGVRTTTIRCGSDSPLKDVFIPDEIKLDVHDLPAPEPSPSPQDSTHETVTNQNSLLQRCCAVSSRNRVGGGNHEPQTCARHTHFGVSSLHIRAEV